MVNKSRTGEYFCRHMYVWKRSLMFPVCWPKKKHPNFIVMLNINNQILYLNYAKMLFGFSFFFKPQKVKLK